jgi:assimilatory nitrate reductase catalytic subunit
MNMHMTDPPPVRTACPYCGVGCGVLARPDGKGGAAIAGDPDHPANVGRLCSKGTALGETLSLEGRLLHPMLRTRTGGYERVSWDVALDKVAKGFARIARDHGPDATAFYLSGQLLTEDYYAANKLMKGFLGTANVDTNSRLCMASSVAGHRRSFGSDTVPGTYEDLDLADLVVLVGSNAAWCHPVLYQRMVAARRTRGQKIVVIDPRRTATCEDADLLLKLRPGTDTVLFSGLLAYLADRGGLHRAYIATHTTGFDAALAAARALAPDVEAVARLCDLPAVDVAAFFDLFARTEKVVTCYSQGVNQSAQGTDKVGAIIACHLATGRIGKPGLGPFSLTGQPNAMGGREVGGLANMLAAHMGFAPQEVDRVRRFWSAPKMATREGLKAVQMFDAVADGRIRALWVMGTNPAVSLPCADHVRASLSALDLFVVSENVLSNDTVNSGAHVLLPAHGWGEKDGTVTNSERRITRQRAFLPAPGEAKADWWIVAEVGRRLGFADAFDWRSAADVFREHAALSAFENDGTRDFDLSGLAHLDARGYADLAPVQWPVRPGQSGDSRFFAEGGFFTPDRKARFVVPALPALAATGGDVFPLLLNTGRVRDQWHTMTRTGKSPRLARHRPEPTLDIHPDDAARFALIHGGFARVDSAHGAATLRVVVTDAQRPGEVFAPIHWTAENSTHGRIGPAVQPATDPFSGQPEMKATPCRVVPVAVTFAGFALSRSQLRLDGAIGAHVALDGGTGTILALDEPADGFGALARRLFAGKTALAEYEDRARGLYRAAVFDADGRLDAALFLGPVEAPPVWDALIGLFAGGPADATARRLALSGQSTDGVASAGPLVCACFGVGLAAIEAALSSGEAADVAGIGRALKAGTNCGSCLPDLKKIVAARAATVPA